MYNNSTSEITFPNISTLDPPRPRNEELAKIEVILQAVILVLNVIGNGAVLSILASLSRGKNLSRMYTMIGHLSIADLFVAAFNILPQLIWDVTYRFKGGRVLCKTIKYFQVTTIYAPSYVLVSTAVDRYIAICHPMRGHTWSSTTAHRLVLYSFSISLIFSLPQLFIFDYVQVAPDEYDCWEHFEPGWTLQLYITWFTLAVYVIPLLILIAIYTRICFVVWHSSSDKAIQIQQTIRERQPLRVKESGQTNEQAPIYNNGHCTNSDIKQNGVHDVHEKFACERKDVRNCGENCVNSELKLSHSVNDYVEKEKSIKGVLGNEEFGEDSCICSIDFSISKDKVNGKTYQNSLHHENNLRSDIKSETREKTLLEKQSGLELKPQSSISGKNISDKTKPDASFQDSLRVGKPQPSWKSRRGVIRSAGSVESSGPSSIPTPSRARLRTVKLTLTVVISYLVCWGPFFFAQMWYAWDPNSKESLEETAVVLTLLLASLNSCTNPWIYLAFSDHLRRRLVYFCCFIFRSPCCHLKPRTSDDMEFNVEFLRRSRGKLSYTSSGSRFDSRQRTNR